MENLLDLIATVAAVYLVIANLARQQRATRNRRFMDAKAMAFEIWANRVTAVALVAVFLGAIWL